MTREEAAKTLTFSLSKVDALIANGELPAVKVGRRVVIQQRHVRELLERAETREATVDQQTRAAQSVLDNVETRLAGGDLIGSAKAAANIPIHLRLLEAIELLAFVARSTGQPDELLAALRERVNSASTD